MKKLTLLVIGLVYFNVTSVAGDARGNGGHAIVCRDNLGKVISIEILDFYEAREYRGIERDLGPADLSVKDKIKIALDRISRFEFRGTRYLKETEEFENNALFKTGITLVNVPDTNHLAFPKGCGVEQVINQRQPQFPEDKLYLVNADLWNLLDNDNKAAFILHEVVFGELISEGHFSSDGARYYNSYITSRKMDTWFLRNNYFNLLKHSGFKEFWWHNLPLEAPDPLLCSEGGCSLKKGIWWGSRVSRPTLVNIGPNPQLVYHTLVITQDCNVELYPSGNIQEGCFVTPDQLGKSEFESKLVQHLWFDKEGNITGQELKPNFQNLFYVGLSGWIEAKSIIWFYPGHGQGQRIVMRMQLKYDHTVVTEAGPKLLQANTIISFNEKGIATKWFMPN